MTFPPIQLGIFIDPNEAIVYREEIEVKDVEKLLKYLSSADLSPEIHVNS